MESSYWANYSDFYDGKLYIAGINNDAEKFKEFCFVPQKSRPLIFLIVPATIPVQEGYKAPLSVSAKATAK